MNRPVQFITATTSTTSYPGTQTTQTQDVEPPPVAAKEQPVTTSKFREIRQPPAKRRNEQPESTAEQCVVVPGNLLLNDRRVYAKIPDNTV